MSGAIVEEDLCYICRILRDLDCVAVSTAGASTLERPFTTHCDRDVKLRGIEKLVERLILSIFF